MRPFLTVSVSSSARRANSRALSSRPHDGRSSGRLLVDSHLPRNEFSVGTGGPLGKGIAGGVAAVGVPLADVIPEEFGRSSGVGAAGSGPEFAGALGDGTGDQAGEPSWTQAYG